MDDVIRQLGRYELLRRIAVGGMGEIFLARMRGAAGFEKQVIIKTILPHLAEEPEFVSKFLDEGRIVVQLTHGNIVPVFDMGEENGEYFIAMEYISGRDLREVIKRLAHEGKTMPVDLCVYVIIEACKGLGYAHRKLDEQGQELQLVHRDVSPSNILISHEGEVKVIDFGIARATGRRAQTVSGRIQGKFNYMSPEQASGLHVDERSDLFSTAVVLYEMLTGVRPFQGDTDLKTLDLVRRCEVDPASLFRPEIPQELDDILGRALCHSLEDRYRSIDAMQADLQHYLYTAGQPVGVKDFIEFLRELFPEGVERKDLRVPGSSGPSGPKNLDDALDLELERMLAGDIDPLTATADSNILPTPDHHTATLAGDVPLLAPVFSQQPARVTPTPTHLEPPETSIEDAQDTDDVDTPDEPSEEAVVPAPAPAQLPDAPGAPGLKRGVAAIALLVLIAGGAGMVGTRMWDKNGVGSLRVESQPEGALIFVDGARMPERTPATLKLAVGRHQVQLRKDGFAHTDKMSVSVERNVLGTLSPRPLALQAQRTSRRFTLTSAPAGASVQIKGSIAQQGVTPMLFELERGQFANITLSAPNCTSKSVPVTDDTDKEALHIDLACTTPASVATPVAATVTPKPTLTQRPAANTKRPPRAAPFVVTVTPDSAQIAVKSATGTQRGTGKLKGYVPTRGTIEVQASAPGYEPQTRRLSAASLPPALRLTLSKAQQGCLTFRTGHPQLNTYILDGKNLGARTSLKNHKLSPGPHTLTIENTTAGKRETFSLNIAAGDVCTRKFVWPIPK